MRLALFAVLGLTAIVAAPAAEADTKKKKAPPQFEVHEIGYLDLNRKQTVRGWLREIPRSTALQATQVMAMWGREQDWRGSASVPTPRDPALLFYSNELVRANVTITLPGGAPVAWWPSGTANGRTLRFNNVEINPKRRPASPEALKTSKYPGLLPLKYIREIGATPVRVNGKTEGGLVYEGIVPFNPKLTVKHLRKEGYEIHNGSTMTLHDVILIPDGERSRGYLVGDMKAGATFWVKLGELEKHQLSLMIDLHLQRTGLFPGEVVALRKTLLSADFVLDPGVRLLARVPPAVWARRFVLNIWPKPRQILRVGVIRLFDAVAYRAVDKLPTIDPALIRQRGETRERRPVDVPRGAAGGR
jgi:hypothetical protein